ncbi:MAG: DsbA family protein [Cyanobacteria bacterium]|nr:DsbA family protein [Cyanobacteriota bacterium]
MTIRDSAFKGDPAAPIVIVEFSDFECPFCARHFRDTFKRIDERYIRTGTVKYVFRHLPLEDIHPQAFFAAEVAECSRQQGLFWEIHDRFFTAQRELRALDLRAQAVASGVDRGRLDDCLRESGRKQVLRDLADARRLGSAGTPLFVVGRPASSGIITVTHSINGARPFEIFESVLTELKERP